MTDEEKAKVAAIFGATVNLSFLSDVAGQVADDFNTTSLAQVEAGKDYEIFGFGSAKGKTKDQNGVMRDANVIWLDLVEVSAKVPARVFLGTLKRNMTAASKAGLLGKFGEVKTALTGKTLKMHSYINEGQDARGRAIIRLDYTIQ